MKTRMLNKKEKLIVQKTMDKLWDGYGYSCEFHFSCNKLEDAGADSSLMMAYKNFCGNLTNRFWFSDCKEGPERQLARWMCLWFFMKAGEVEI